MSLHVAPTVRARACRAVACRVAILTSALLVSFGAWPGFASAHGISGRASLPVPAWLFAWAAAIVLIASFVLLSMMWSRPRLQRVRERRLCEWPTSLTVLAGLVGLALFALV